MDDVRKGLPGLLFAATCILLAALTVRFLRADASETAPLGLPTPEHLDSLSRYLKPVEDAPRLDDYGMFLPADIADGPARPATISAGPAAIAAPEWRVSAIIITTERPVAIVNDLSVSPGSELPDGSVVESIDRNQVVIRRPDGIRQRLTLTTG